MNDNRARELTSACAAAKNGSPKPSATEPPTIARLKSTTAASDASARPRSSPVRSMMAIGARCGGRPVSASIAGPQAYASRQPMPPHAHGRPSGSTTMWPMWPALPSRPLSRRPLLMMPPPTPVPTTTPTMFVSPRAAPHHVSPSMSAFASLSTYTGNDVASTSAACNSKFSHVGMCSGETVFLAVSIGPPQPAPTATIGAGAAAMTRSISRSSAGHTSR